VPLSWPRVRSTEGHMPRIRITPALLMLLALATTSASRASRAEDCLAGPNAQAPQGSHWYYRLDRATHRKCWYIGAQHAQRAPHRRAAERADSAPEPRDEDVPAREAPPATPPATVDVAPEAAAPAPPAPAAAPPERMAPRTVATTTERVRAPATAPAKPPETAKPAAAAAIPAPASEARGALPAALFGIALLLAAVGTMLVRARGRMIRVNVAASAAPASRRVRRNLSDILAQAERGEPDHVDAATTFFERLRRGLDENGARAADDEPPLVPPPAANAPDITAATLQPAIEELVPETPGSTSPGVAPAPDFEQSLRQLLAEWERRAA
jgi:hypothetical protein